jgi:hypothetical protein
MSWIAPVPVYSRAGCHPVPNGAMLLIPRTNFMRRKFRSAIATLTTLIVGGLCVALPGTASARIAVSAFTVPPTLDKPSPSKSVSLVEPAIEPAPDGSNSEWFLVNAQWQDLLSVTPTGTMGHVGTGFSTDSGPPDTYASVDADGFDWILDNSQGSPEQALYAAGAPGSPHAGVTRVASFNGYSEDITLGSDGDLYIADNAGNIIQCAIKTAPSAICVPAPISGPFDGGAYSIGSGGNAIWFTDAAGNLNAYSGGVFSGPYWSGASIDPGTIVTAGNGNVYVAAGSSAGGDNTEILTFGPGDASSVQVASSGFQNLVSMTIGPDGNIWFLDAGGDNGAGVIGKVNITNHVVSELPLPHGYMLPSTGARISPGPNVPGPGSTGEVFFTAAAAGSPLGTAAIGEVSGIPMPVIPGHLAFKPAVAVSKQHIAALTLTCTGATNAECAGKMTLSVKAKVKVQQRVRAARKGVKAKFRTVTNTKNIKLASLSYDIPGGKTQHPSVLLSDAAYKLLEQVSGHEWTATVSKVPSVGTVTGNALSMTGPVPSSLKNATTKTRGAPAKTSGGAAARKTTTQK